MEFTAAMYSSEKLRQYYGLSLWVDPGPARKHMCKLKGHPYYMTIRRISQLSGISESNLCQVSRGYRSEGRDFEPVRAIHRDTEAAVLGVRPEIDDGIGRSGGQVPPLGTRRRLQGLVAAGFPLRILSEGINWGPDPQPVHRFIREKAGRKYVQASTYRRALALYEKLEHVKPEDMGVSPVAAERARRSARLHGYAPPWTWDDDTIDDPDASPEWTGECGTEEGYRIHIRETLAGNRLPPCEACRAVVEVVREAGGEKPFVFHHEAFSEALEEKGLNPRQLAIKMGRRPVEADRFYRWRTGSRNPQNRAEVYALAVALGIDSSVLMHDKPDEELKPNIIGRGAFNHYTFKAVIETAALSQREVAEILGVSHGGVSKWAKGSYAPGKKETLTPLAEKLGIDVEVFYQ